MIPAQIAGPQISCSAAGNMVAFFNFLPTDLQIHIFHTWVRGEDAGDGDRPLLLVFSALDIACGKAQSLRKTFLHIAGLMRFKTAVDDNHCSLRISKSAFGFLAWLNKLNLQVKSLVLAENHNEDMTHAQEQGQLKSIEHVHLMSSFAGQEVLDHVLRSCPNVTSVRVPNGESVASIWQTLASAPAMKFKALLLPSCEYAGAHMLQLLGEYLQVLDIAYTPVTDAVLLHMADKCKNLQKLDMLTIVPLTSLSSIVSLLQSCKHLKTLTLNSFVGNEAHITTILLAGKASLKQLTLNFGCFSMSYKPFADLVAAHPWIRCLTFRTSGLMFASYCRDSQHLDMVTKHHSSNDDCAVVFKACPAVTKLTVRASSATVENTQTMLQIAEAYPNVLELTIIGGSDLSMYELITNCRRIKTMKIQALSISSLCLTACAHCKQLESLTLDAMGSSTTVEDQDLVMLLSKCPGLKVLDVGRSPHITFRTLQAMLDRKVHLKTFTWKFANFAKGDEDRFRQLAKAQQMLPVPRLLREV